jgi:small multidrug resistance pump
MDILYLILAILFEVFATASLKASNEFRNILPSLIVVVGYMGSFYFLTMSLRTLPLGIVYATWSGVGIIFTILIGKFYYKEDYSLTTLFGIGMIMVGVIIVHLTKERESI